MGVSESKAEVKKISEQISNIAMSTAQSCEVASQQDQTLEVNNTGFKLWGSYSMKQQTEIRSDCFSDVNKQMELQNKIIENISNASTAKGVGILGAFAVSKADAVTNLTNIVKNNITMSNIQNSYTSIKQNQSAKFNNSGIIGFETVDLTQGGKLFAAATLQEMDKAGIFNTIDSFVASKAEATIENPLKVIADMISSISSTAMMGIAFFIIIIPIGLMMMGMLGGGGGGGGGNRDD